MDKFDIDFNKTKLFFKRFLTSAPSCRALPPAVTELDPQMNGFGWGLQSQNWDYNENIYTD